MPGSPQVFLAGRLTRLEPTNQWLRLLLTLRIRSSSKTIDSNSVTKSRVPIHWFESIRMAIEAVRNGDPVSLWSDFSYKTGFPQSLGFVFSQNQLQSRSPGSIPSTDFHFSVHSFQLEGFIYLILGYSGFNIQHLHRSSTSQNAVYYKHPIPAGRDSLSRLFSWCSRSQLGKPRKQFSVCMFPLLTICPSRSTTCASFLGPTTTAPPPSPMPPRPPLSQSPPQAPSATSAPTKVTLTVLPYTSLVGPNST